MHLDFYQDYEKCKHSDLRQYKIQFLKSKINEDRVYKFISFDDNSELNRIKLRCLKNGELWFSYYRYLNDKTEFDIKYDVNRVSKKTGIPCGNIKCFVDTMKEIYDVCSLTYSYDEHMWEVYGNQKNGLCLVFKVLNYDMLYPVEYVDKSKVDYTDMLIEAYNTEAKELFEKGIIMAELPYVIKNPDNGNLKSYLEKEVRILLDPFEDGILNSGRIYPGVKLDNSYKGRNVCYDKCGLEIEKIIVGSRCSDEIVQYIRGMEINTTVSFQNILY